MTRDEHRAKCIEAMKEAIDNEAFGRFDSISSDVIEIAFDALDPLTVVLWRLGDAHVRESLTNPPENKP